MNKKVSKKNTIIDENQEQIEKISIAKADETVLDTPETVPPVKATKKKQQAKKNVENENNDLIESEDVIEEEVLEMSDLSVSVDQTTINDAIDNKLVKEIESKIEEQKADVEKSVEESEVYQEVVAEATKLELSEEIAEELLDEVEKIIEGSKEDISEILEEKEEKLEALKEELQTAETSEEVAAIEEKIEIVEATSEIEILETSLSEAEKIREAKIEALDSEKLTVLERDKAVEKIDNEYFAQNEITIEKIKEIETSVSLKEILNVSSEDKSVSNKVSLRLIKRNNNKARAGKIESYVKNPNNIVEISDLVKYYTTAKMAQQVLKGINLEIEKGDFVILFGKSGSGKSTLLNIISGLDRATFGDVIINTSNVTRMSDSQITKFRRQNMGFIFQRYNLLPNLTAYENVETGAYLEPKRAKRLNIKEIFELMDISDVMHKYPSEMSGGQQQRVSIARALVKNPQILFADEPTGALDDKMSLAVLKILSDINKKYGTTIIMVSHNPTLADMATKVVTLKSGYISEIAINKNPVAPENLNW